MTALVIAPDTPAWWYKPVAELTNDQLIAALRDPRWRLRNLYWITTKDRKADETEEDADQRPEKRVIFKPWREQEQFLADLWFRNIILKARQRGFSTLIQLMMLDTCIFVPDTRASVVAHEKNAAGKIFRDKIKFAYDNLPDLVKEIYPLKSQRSQSELMLCNNSALSVDVSARSGTIDFLHISEFGKICAKYPDKAREIVTGSLPAVPTKGIVCIESTAEGQDGAFYDMTRIAQDAARQKRDLTELDYRFHFAPWWDADEYELPDDVVVPPDLTDYFERMETTINRPITRDKRAWYAVTLRSTFSGDDQKMKQEYPSTPEEAFEQATEGKYLARQMAQVRREGRICRIPYLPGIAVDTWWDLGLDDSLTVWCHQRLPDRDHFINFLEGLGDGYAAIWGRLQRLGYTFGTHHLPHDATRRFPGAEWIKTPAEMLGEVGVKPIEIVDRVTDLINVGLEQLRNDFPNYWFDEVNCDAGIKHLDLYQKGYNERLGAWTNQPLKNGHDHAPDALRQKAQWDAAHPGQRRGPRRLRRGGSMVT